MKLPTTLNLPNPDELIKIDETAVKDHLKRINDELQKNHKRIYDVLADHEARIEALEP